MGMANASTCLSDIWASHNNVAGLAEIKAPATAFALHTTPSLEFLNRMAMTLAVPFSHATAALGIFRFGDDLYNEHMITIGVANRFGLASLGVRANYIQYHADGAGTRVAFSAGFGGIASLTPNLRVGAHILHVNQPIVNTDTGERLPTRMATGVAYVAPDKLHIAVEAEKETGYPTTIKAGMEYRFVPRLAFRTGFHLNPDTGFFGLGFTTSRFRIDYAVQLNTPLGIGHQASVVYEFKRK